MGKEHSKKHLPMIPGEWIFIQYFPPKCIAEPPVQRLRKVILDMDISQELKVHSMFEKPHEHDNYVFRETAFWDKEFFYKMDGQEVSEERTEFDDFRKYAYQVGRRGCLIYPTETEKCWEIWQKRKPKTAWGLKAHLEAFEWSQYLFPNMQPAGEW